MNTPIQPKSNTPVFEALFTYDDREQDLARIPITATTPMGDEAALIRWVIAEAFSEESAAVRTLVKISGCIEHSGNEDIVKTPAIRDFLKRNGKYYFQPNQRDSVESAIIEGTATAADTKPFQR